MNDSELVHEAQLGNETAFSELVRRYQPASFRLAIGVLRNREEAEDEVQNAMCKAFEHIRQFEGQAQFSTWLTRIVLNQCFMRLRQLRKRSVLSMDSEIAVDSLNESTTRIVEEDSPEEKIGREQMLGLLQQELSRLPLLLRSALLIRDIQQRPYPLAAQELGITIPALKSRLLRARLELKARLKERCGSVNL